MTQQAEKKINLKPLGNRVIARRLEEEKTLKSGIIIPDSAAKKQETVEIVAIGSGTKTKNGTIIEIPVAVGNKVLMDKYAGQDVKVGDVEYVVLKADDIIAIIED